MDYAVAVKPMSDAFAAIQRFDPEAVIEIDRLEEDVEYYTIQTEFRIDALFDDNPGIIEWNVVKDYDCDFPPDDPPTEPVPILYQDWDCWQHPSSGWHEAKRNPKTLDKISDYALTKLIDDPETAAFAAAEWRRRYPAGVAATGGVKIWARGYDEKVKTL